MEVGKTLRSEAADSRRPVSWSRTLGLLNPLRAVWWLFTNVRFAILLLVVVAAAGVVGVVVPQVPLSVRGDAVAEADWLNLQEGRFGFLTQPMDRLGLFDIFHARWFAVLLAMTVVSTGAYIVSRFPGIWASMTRPRMRVPDRYFEMAPARAEATSSLDVARLERLLKRQRYSVQRFQEGGAVYLFADRFQWAQLGTLLTHSAVIVFILAALVSRMDSFESPLFLAEGSTLPVFPVRNPEQLQVQLVDAHAEFTADGQPTDYRSDIVIYQNGEEVKVCTSTVNSPCTYHGYRFYQAAYFGFGAAVQVRDLSTGNTVYRETLALSDRSPSPRVLISDQDGRTLLDDKLVLTDTLDTGAVKYDGTLVTLPDGRTLAIGLEGGEGGERRLVVLDTAQRAGAASLVLGQGQTAEADGLKVTYVKESMTPSAGVPDFPRPPAVDAPAAGDVRLQLSNVVYGTATASEGTKAEAPAAGAVPRLTITGLTPQAIALQPGQSSAVNGYEYTFLGQREFAGIQVKRDRSDYFVWIGAALILAGLMITFWVPRRRLWARITSTGAALAGQAPAHARYSRELRRLALEAGASGTRGIEGDDDS